MPIPAHILRENPEIGKGILGLLSALREANPLVDVGKVKVVCEAIDGLVVTAFNCGRENAE